MHIEHLGLNVSDPIATADWYVRNLRMRVARKSGEPHHPHFLVDAAGRMVVEIYGNAAAPVPDYPALHPLVLHLAFSVADVGRTREALLAAGATAEGEVEKTPAGDDIAMLRDPWGLPIQLVRRAQPLT